MCSNDWKSFIGRAGRTFSAVMTDRSGIASGSEDEHLPDNSGSVSIRPAGRFPIALIFWQKAMPGGRSWDGETVVRTHDFVLWIRSTVTRRAGDFSTPVTVRGNAAIIASGTHQSLTGRLTSTARRTGFSDSIRPRQVNWQAALKTSQFA